MPRTENATRLPPAIRRVVDVKLASVLTTKVSDTGLEQCLSIVLQTLMITNIRERLFNRKLCPTCRYTSTFNSKHSGDMEISTEDA
jgi:hypothetical protein